MFDKSLENSSNHINDTISGIENRIKDGKFVHKKKLLKPSVMHKVNKNIPNIEREKSCRHARLTAWTQSATNQREKSREVRDDLGI